jgi:hypothetical protein
MGAVTKADLRERWRAVGAHPTLPDVSARLAELDRRPRSERLDDYAERIVSQHGEDGVTYELLKRVGMGSRTCVEIGCGHNGGNTGFLVAGLGYRGLFLDGDKELISIGAATFADTKAVFRHAWITRETVNELLQAEGFSGEIDCLGVDLDGIDLWIWESLTAVRSRLVVIEYNAWLGPDVSVTIPYMADFSRKAREAAGGLVWPKGYFGASLRALERRGRSLGYRLVATAPSSSNAYFVRADLAAGTPTLTVEQAFRPPTKRKHVAHAERIARIGVDAWAARSQVELVEID